MGGFSRVNINMSAVYLSHSQLHLSKPSHTYIQLFSAVNLSSRAPFALRQRVLIMPILCSRTNYTNVFYKETGTALNLSSLVSWEPTNLQSKINCKFDQEKAYPSRHMYLEFLAGVFGILFKMRVLMTCPKNGFILIFDFPIMLENCEAIGSSGINYNFLHRKCNLFKLFTYSCISSDLK